jgi:hypothetical protein
MRQLTDTYNKHQDYMNLAKPVALLRKPLVLNAMREAFSEYIEKCEVEAIVFENVSAARLAEILHKYPILLKPLLTICNVAGRAIKRDLGLRNINTYKPSLNENSAMLIAGYIKNFLPQFIEIPVIVEVDQFHFIDKEIRKGKGAWEAAIRKALNAYADISFKKRKFQYNNEQFELDAASPIAGDIAVGVDVKRIEAREDIHKRIDEIVNKASKFKKSFPTGKFLAFIYYPYFDEHSNIISRLQSEDIDSVKFAGSDL